MRTLKNILFQSILLISIGLLYSCGISDSSTPTTTNGNGTGVGGSLARFTINGDKLYTLSGSNIKAYTMSPNGTLTLFNTTTTMNNAIETIFCKGNALFVGTSSGMFIYELTSNGVPMYKSFYSHMYSCDPVVADDKYAYITLRTSNEWGCNRGRNVLEIIDIQDLSYPDFIQSYSMVSPKGLGIDSNLLFICDDFLKVYDKTNLDSLKLIFSSNVKGNDVIPFDNKLMLTSDAGFYQYQYSNNTLTLLSTILIGQ